VTRSRWKLAWDWYASLGFGTWLLTAGILAGAALVVAVVVGHGSSPNTACRDSATSVTVINRYDGHRLTAHGAAELHRAGDRLESASRSAIGATKSVLAEAAQVAGSAKAGQRFDAGPVGGRYDGVCNFAGGGEGKAGGL
jgi:hypothetical protein